MIRVGIIGCGSIAGKRHAPACAAYSQCEIAGFYDRNLIHAEELAEKYGGQVYAELDSMLEDQTVEAVIVCVPEKYHCDVVVQCLEAGKKVLCEKPMAMNVQEAQKMLKVEKNTLGSLMIAFSQRFYQQHTLAKELILAGEIGTVFSFRTCFSNPGVEYTVHKDMQENFFDRNLGNVGNILTNVGCHRIDLMRYLFDSDICELSACTPTLDKRYSDGRFIEAEDHAMITVKMANGIIGTIWASWCGYGVPEDFGTWIFGTKGVIKTYVDGGIEVCLKDGSKKHIPIIADEKELLGWDVTQSFLDGCIAGGKLPVTGKDGLACMFVIDAALESNRQKRWVEVEQI